jgi:antirestriction protein ArdC
MSKSNKVIETAVDKIISLMEAGDLNWNKSWSAKGMTPCNYQSKRPYRGWNYFAALLSGFSSPYYLTYNQVTKMGGQVIKGSKGLPMIFWKPFKVKVEKLDENGNKVERIERRLVAKSFTVFNAEQIEGIDFKDVELQGKGNEAIAEMESVIENMQNRPQIVYKDPTSAYYSPMHDHVNMPKLEQFKDSESFYSVMVHELIHSTGHESRLNRESITSLSGFGSHEYSFEELIAELGSNMLLSLVGIANDNLDKQSAAYIKGWLKPLKDDKMMLYKAATQAQKAVDYIMGTTPNYDNEESEESSK